jgi:hypothetical protein
MRGGVRWGVVRAAAWATVAISGVGAAHSVRRNRTARFLAVPVPGSPAVHACTIGSPLSAPPLMLAALVAAATRERAGVVRLLSAGFLVGILGEVDTWSVVRRPTSDPVAAACVAGYLALPAVMLVSAGSRSGPR